MKRRPLAIFLALTVAAGALVAGYVMHAMRRGDAAAPIAATPAPPTTPATPATPPAQAQDTEHTADVAPLEGQPPAAAPPPSAARAPQIQRVFYRHTGVDSHYGNVAWVDAREPAAVHFVDSLRCEVVYVAGGHGICMSADRGVFTTYAASLFDARSFAVSASFPLKGIPSRARVSVDGALAALTVFVSGHGYTTLDFSTQTLLIDVATGTVLADLEDFEVRRAGVVIRETDFNFWGVTFTPDARQFYATLSTGGRHLLIRGDIAARRAEVIHENVECPSLSPDARHVAYKKRLVVDNRILWQLHVLELASGREVALSERRSIDDQLEWLDDGNVLYSVPSADDDSSPGTDVWMAPRDARSAPRPFLRNAYSPARVRCSRAEDCAPAAGKPAS